MIFFWIVTCYYTPTLHKNAKKPTVMWFFTQIFFESTVQQKHIRKRHEDCSIFKEVAPLIKLPVCCIDQSMATHGGLRAQFQICFIHPLILSFVQQYIFKQVIRKFVTNAFVLDSFSAQVCWLLCRSPTFVDTVFFCACPDWPPSLRPLPTQNTSRVDIFTAFFQSQ